MLNKTKISGFTFGEALDYLKMGKCVARKGWNGKGMYLFLASGEDLQGVTRCNVLKYESAYEVEDSIVMKTAKDTLVVGWHASQSDMLADDWCIFVA